MIMWWTSLSSLWTPGPRRASQCLSCTIMSMAGPQWMVVKCIDGVCCVGSGKVASIWTGKEEGEQIWKVERVHNGPHRATQGGCKISHQLSRLGSHHAAQMVLRLVLSLHCQVLTLSFLGSRRVGGSQAKVHLGWEGRGAPPGSSYLPTF